MKRGGAILGLQRPELQLQVWRRSDSVLPPVMSFTDEATWVKTRR